MSATLPLRRNPVVDILVRGWDNLALTRRLLTSIKANTDGLEYQVIYVDNGSTLHLAAELMKDFPWVTFVRLPFNHGSVRAINLGLCHALSSPAPYVLLLDNDTEIPAGDKGWLTRFVGYLADETVGAAGAVSNYVSGYQFCEALPPTYTREWQEGTERGLKEQDDQPVLVSFAMLLRKSAVQQLGFFDERFEPGMGEDYDYTLRLREAGYRCVLAPSVWVHHKGSQTFKRFGFDELLAQSMGKLIAKWGVDGLAKLGLQVEQAAPAPEAQAMTA